MNPALRPSFREQIQRSRRYSRLAKILLAVAFASQFVVPLAVLIGEYGARTDLLQFKWALYLVAPDPKFDPVMNQYPEQLHSAGQITEIGAAIVFLVLLVVLTSFWRRARTLKRFIRRKRLAPSTIPPLSW